jgi:hypothetical protein
MTSIKSCYASTFVLPQCKKQSTFWYGAQTKWLACRVGYPVSRLASLYSAPSSTQLVVYYQWVREKCVAAMACVFLRAAASELVAAFYSK